MAAFTKQAIKASFLKLLGMYPLRDISVKMIVEDCGINRKSFYYHYQDIPARLEEILTEQADALLASYQSVHSLEECLTAQHVCNVCACITYPNPPSIAFHEKHGYKTVAHFHASGYKQDAWHDMIWMEKTLCPHTIPPRPFIPFPEL